MELYKLVVCVLHIYHIALACTIALCAQTCLTDDRNAATSFASAYVCDIEDASQQSCLILTALVCFRRSGADKQIPGITRQGLDGIWESKVDERKRDGRPVVAAEWAMVGAILIR